MARFDTRVQKLKYDVLKEVIHYLDNETKDPLDILNISKKIIPGRKPTFRCCVYKERAIVDERVKVILNADSQKDENVVKVIGIACDECAVGGYTVTNSCRGCIAHRCVEACPKKCITFDDELIAHIDKTQCVNCGMCAKACPYQAIENRIRPCERACKQKAISPNPETFEAMINDEKCIHCGACVYTCPFGAIVDISYIKEIIALINDAKKNSYKVHAIVAPSIGGNFIDFKTGQIVSAIKKLGFDQVVEAALGADLVSIEESSELVKHGILTSSCCPAFAGLIRKFYPELVKYISSSLSPMAEVAKFLKEKDPTCKTVFIGPCTAKKSEIRREQVRPYVDLVMTFEELQAFIDARNIDVASLEEEDFIKGSSYGRGFAQCGGLSKAVDQALKEQGIEFEVKGLSCDGIDNIKKALIELKKENPSINFLEGMVCDGGCIGGPCNLQHTIKNKILVGKYSNEATKDITGNIEKNK